MFRIGQRVSCAYPDGTVTAKIYNGNFQGLHPWVEIWGVSPDEREIHRVFPHQLQLLPPGDAPHPKFYSEYVASGAYTGLQTTGPGQHQASDNYLWLGNIKGVDYYASTGPDQGSVAAVDHTNQLGCSTELYSRIDDEWVPEEGRELVPWGDSLLTQREVDDAKRRQQEARNRPGAYRVTVTETITYQVDVIADDYLDAQDKAEEVLLETEDRYNALLGQLQDRQLDAVKL